MGRQSLAAVVVTVYAFAVTWVVATVAHRTMGFRVDPSDERSGLDLLVHGETAYESGTASSAHLASVLGRPSSDAVPPDTAVPSDDAAPATSPTSAGAVETD